ncbi:hypothetical protein F1721_32885 [Saccharopolyspora hirsuta]|uniref:Uncharacterized protein n=1 Tax=Saccharopolyspora hirsuta TaxID=1837 RepID=A0A5M7BDZ5_SACHI|nr:hypothetical protein [Saccharopolyspora hirsuta]KAA5825435.1 hypothetical protein F1721_32885 [Saccharopolyspora hirsuta]
MPIHIVDSATYRTPNYYEFTETAHLDRYIIRARVRRDFYQQQSFARAHVLADDMTWTHLIDEDPHDWHPGTAPPRDTKLRPEYELAAPAYRLLQRAEQILLPCGPTCQIPDTTNEMC